mgnify:FL=1
MPQKPETLADLKAEAERLKAQNDKMFADALDRLDQVEQAIDKREAEERGQG